MVGSPPLPSAEDLVVWDQSTEDCTLPCYIERNVSQPPPQVSWFGSIHSREYFALSDSAAWEKQYRKELCKYGSAQYKNFTHPSDFQCTAVSSGSYNCNHVLGRCYYGSYQCRVEFADGRVVEKNTLVTRKLLKHFRNKINSLHFFGLAPEFLIIEPRDLRCFHPLASNLSGELLSTGDGEAEIEFKWHSSTNKAISGCKLKYCPGARQYEVKITAYDYPAPREEGFVSVGPHQVVYESLWTPTKKKRQTKHLFHYLDNVSTKLFQFTVKNERPFHTNAAQSVDIDRVRITTSHIFYFGEQGME